MNCIARTYGGAINSANGLNMNISLCCFSQCNTLTNLASAAYVRGASQAINETIIFGCGKSTSHAVTYFSGEKSDISQTNFSKSNKLYSVSSFTEDTKNLKISYVNTALCNSSSGVALHANRCNAFVEYNNIVNNTNIEQSYGLVYFNDTSVNLSHVILIKNTRFKFNSGAPFNCGKRMLFRHCQ